MALEITEKSSHRVDVKLIHLSGDLDTCAIEDFADKIYPLVQRGNSVILDFEDLDYLNSTGCAMILHLTKSAEKLGKSVFLCNVNERIEEIFAVIDVRKYLSVYEDVKEAQGVFE